MLLIVSKKNKQNKQHHHHQQQQQRNLIGSYSPNSAPSQWFRLNHLSSAPPNWLPISQAGFLMAALGD